MKLELWVISVSYVFAVVGIIWSVLKKVNRYRGQNITLTTNDHNVLSVKAESVTAEAASGNFFCIRSPGGETIIGKQEKPLEWWVAYFIAKASKVKGGEWIVEKGSDITIHLSGSGSDEVTVEETLTSGWKVIDALQYILAATFIWFVTFIVLFVRPVY